KARSKFLDTLSMSLSLLTNFKDDKGKSSYPIGLKSLKLKDLYEYITSKELPKTQRDIFVTGTLEDVVNEFQESMTYCAKDVEATHLLLGMIWKPFKLHNPSLVTFGGILEMSSAILPLNTGKWQKYIDLSDQITDSETEKISKKLQKLALDSVKEVKVKKKKNLSSYTLNWSTTCLEAKNSFQRNTDLSDLCLGNLESLSERNFKKCSAGKLGVPTWYAKLCPNRLISQNNSTFDLRPTKITSWMIDTLKLLGLRYGAKGSMYDMVYDENYKWGFLLPGRPTNILEKEKKPEFDFPFS
ncbi:MAG: hypothetical protein MHPSP_000266, partial [Paramarteilia canceri]